MKPETLNVIAALLVYGVFHSLTAALHVKAVFVSLMGQRVYLGFYRLFYNTVSGITLLPVLALVAAEPGPDIWVLDDAPEIAFRVIQLIGVLGGMISLLQIDAMRFVGLRQAAAYLNGDPLPLPDEPLTLTGLYAMVRHPLYLFSLIFVWFEPQMSAAWFGFCIGATVYFLLGSLWEEQKMVRAFGQTYLDYRRRVAWMIPFLKLPASEPQSSGEGG